jgi:hypothetical protein
MVTNPIQKAAMMARIKERTVEEEDDAINDKENDEMRDESLGEME